MNLILFGEEEIHSLLPLQDPRAIHILHTLRRSRGDVFDAGIINGPRGKAMVAEVEATGLRLRFDPTETPPDLHPGAILVGLPRPQTARKILQEVTSLGIGEIHFAGTDKSEPSYSESKLWTTGEYRRHLTAGAEQAFTTRIPRLRRHGDLAAALELLLPRHEGVALDNYEATGPLRSYRPQRAECLLAVGPERGWSGPERDLFRERGVPLLHLGDRPLRTETACLCGLTLLLAKLEWL